MRHEDELIYRKCRDRLTHELTYLRLCRAKEDVLAALYRYQKAYNPDEPRDEYGRWTGGGDSSSDNQNSYDDSDDSEQYADNSRYATVLSDADSSSTQHVTAYPGKKLIKG